MRSSTYSSEAPWRRFIATFAVTLSIGTASLLVLLALLDPYDRGAFGEVYRGTPDGAPRIADASRIRDPAFDAAILGNSHIQLVSPTTLARATDLRVLSLAVPGTGPREQLALLDAFLREHREGTKGLVFGLDETWCTKDPALPIGTPFPFWLYDPRTTVYLTGLMRYTALEQALKRMQFLLGVVAPARRDGYWNYAEGRMPRFLAPAAAEPAESVDDPIANTPRFPALDLLGERLERLGQEVRVALVRPPVHVSALPAAGSDPARAEAACLAAIRRLATRHAATALVDLRRGDPGARDASQWFDETHYAEPVARRIEAAIIAVLTRPEAMFSARSP